MSDRTPDPDGGTAHLTLAQSRSQCGFYAALASGSPGARLAAWPGVQATLVPIRPWFSILNAVVFESPGSLSGSLADLASTYRTAGVHAWRVWVPPEEQQVGEALAGAGYRRADAQPQRMGARLDAVDLEPRVVLDLEPDPTWEMVAQCNDRAYGVLAPWTLAAAFSAMSDPTTQLYAARWKGEVATALVAREQQRDCYFWFVATVPEARGMGLATELMRHALRAATQRGCTTTTLEASTMGESAYARLGFQRLGRFSVWERQDP